MCPPPEPDGTTAWVWLFAALVAGLTDDSVSMAGAEHPPHTARTLYMAGVGVLAALTTKRAWPASDLSVDSHSAVNCWVRWTHW
ncbi:hypothetical protein ACFXKW_27200 [Streptomyces sp. NPDC059193]|uniref:hypothetical protein n=1 Tax=Streptomyces sp. NPDC059193 TaxID=3346763 RepID=UPI003686B5F0